MLYIAYGSNLHLDQMAYRCPTAKVVGASEMPGYDLLFRGGRGSAVATVEPLEGSSVPVLLWDITDRDQRSLDRYEGWPSFYRKELHTVEFEGSTLPAMVYIMNEGRSHGSPSDVYLNTIREGYLCAGFDLDFLDSAVERSMHLGEQEFRERMEAQAALLEQELDSDQLELPGMNDMKWW